MSWLTAAALAQIAIGLCWLIIRWRRLGPWNPEKKPSLRVLAGEMFFNGIPHFVFAYAFMRAFYPFIPLACIYYPLWLFFLWRSTFKQPPPRGKRKCAMEIDPSLVR